MVRLGIWAGLAALIAVTLYSRELERRGTLRCECDASCWCRRRGLSAFRWLVPAGHRCP